MVSNAGGQPIATEATLPLYQAIEAHGLVLILHPATTSLAGIGGLDRVGDMGAGWMLDTVAAALALVRTGTLDACPRLDVVLPHLGGFMPFIAGRLELVLRTDKTAQMEQPLSWYLRNRFYADSVSQTPGALDLAIACFGADRIVFASDHPWMPRERARPVVLGNHLAFVRGRTR